MLRRILWTALAAGLVAGVFVSLAQQVEVVPLILEAETYEAGAATHDEAAAGAGGEHEHGGGAWAPSDGLERSLFTFLSNLLTAIGFALLLGAGFALYGGPVDARRGQSRAWTLPPISRKSATFAPDHGKHGNFATIAYI